MHLLSRSSIVLPATAIGFVEDEEAFPPLDLERSRDDIEATTMSHSRPRHSGH